MTSETNEEKICRNCKFFVRVCGVPCCNHPDATKPVDVDLILGTTPQPTPCREVRYGSNAKCKVAGEMFEPNKIKEQVGESNCWQRWHDTVVEWYCRYL